MNSPWLRKPVTQGAVESEIAAANNGVQRPNKRIKLTIQPVTSRACARSAPDQLAAYAQRQAGGELSKMKLVFSLLALIVVFIYTDSWSCACCARRGDWGEKIWSLGSKQPYAEEILEGLQEITLSGILHTREPEISPKILPESFEIIVKFEDDIWTFYKHDKRTSEPIPVMQFVHSYELTEYYADIGDRNPDIILYKEWRFLGILKSLNEDITLPSNEQATLVLQGSGNKCPDPSRMTHWLIHFRFQKSDEFEFVGADGDIHIGKRDQYVTPV